MLQHIGCLVPCFRGFIAFLYRNNELYNCVVLYTLSIYTFIFAGWSVVSYRGVIKFVLKQIEYRISTFPTDIIREDGSLISNVTFFTSNFPLFMNVLCFLLGNSWCLNFICRRFGTLCLLHLHRRLGMTNFFIPNRL